VRPSWRSKVGSGVEFETSVAEPSAPYSTLTRWCLTPPMSSVAMTSPPAPALSVVLSAIAERPC
jgi:hypothetical protein